MRPTKDNVNLVNWCHQHYCECGVPTFFFYFNVGPQTPDGQRKLFWITKICPICNLFKKRWCNGINIGLRVDRESSPIYIRILNFNVITETNQQKYTNKYEKHEFNYIQTISLIEKWYGHTVKVFYSWNPLRLNVLLRKY